MKKVIPIQHLKGLLLISVLNSLTGSGLISDSVRQHSCQPPDVPSGGEYKKVIDDLTNVNKKNSKQPSDESGKYLPGDEIIYSCKEGLGLMGNRTRSCSFSGDWTGSTPFCDKPVNITSAWVINSNSRDVKRVMDGNHSTCYRWNTSAGSLRVYLSDKAIVRAVRLYLHNGSAELDVNTTAKDKCGSFRVEMGSNHLECQDTQIATENLRFRNISPNPMSVYLCEVQIYIKDGCQTPPNVYVTNGRFEVGRKRAFLLCDSGYKAKSDRVVCENNEWKSSRPECVENVCSGPIGNGRLSDGQWELVMPTLDRADMPGTRRELRCNIGYKKLSGPVIVTCLKNGTWTWTNATCVEEQKKSTRTIVIASVAVVIVLILFFLMGLTIFLVHKQRSREVVVVYKTSTDGSTTAYSEINYAGPHYEAMHGPPVPPSTPRPAFSNVALSDGYLLPADCQSNTLKSTKNDRTPADIAFGTLKSSTVYGT